MLSRAISRYEVRRRGSAELRPVSRWVIHDAGRPFSVSGSALTKWGAMRLARRWQRMDDAATRSYPV